MAGRPVKSWESALELYLSEISKSVKPYTVKKYRWNFSKFFRALDDAGLNSHPSKISEKEIRFLLDVTWSKLESSTRKWYLHTFSTILTRFGNKTIQHMRIRFPQDARTHVDWLTPDEMISLLDSKMSPLELIVIHLELCLGLRNIEIKRLRVQDIGRGYLDACGKGYGDGKWRTVSFHPDTERVLARWMAERDRMISEARQYKPNIVVPDNLIIYKRYKKKPQIGAYSEESNGLTKITIRRIRKRLDFKFANHTLRRTCGRSMWLSKRIQTETISRVYGHNNTKTTMDYIGVNLDDMSEAMDVLRDYQNDKRDKKNEKKTEELK